MKFDDVYAMVGDVPFITKENGRYIYDLILDNKVTNILELGIAHGTATCYMAAALQELGRGSITCVDLIETKETFSPSVEEMLERTGLTEFATVVRMQTGYTWFLHDEIAARTKDDVCHEFYDLCVIDGPKNWTIDGAAFFFVDKLLKPSGWIVFDDYLWTYEDADDRRESTDGITHRSLSSDEQKTPHVREIFNLLVKQHPSYGKLVVREGSDWVLAQKTMTHDKTYTIVHETVQGLVTKTSRRIYKKLRSLRSS